MPSTVTTNITKAKAPPSLHPTPLRPPHRCEGESESEGEDEGESEVDEERIGTISYFTSLVRSSTIEVLNSVGWYNKTCTF
jgi:hypothetical protein